MKRRLAVMLGCCAAACSVEPRQVRLELLTRSSCGWSTQSYDTSCVSSLDVRLLKSDGSVLRSRCTSITGRFSSLAALVGNADVLPLVEDLHPRDNVVIELRAYHSRDKTPCVEPTPDELMLWGRSEPVDLTDDALTVVNVVLECRPECDCAALDADPTRCPATLTPGVCAPPLEVSCAKACVDSSDCYGARLVCIDEACTPEARKLCAVCTSGADCDSGLCVENSVRAEKLCVDRCPPTDSAAACPDLMSCKRVGDELVLIP